MRYIRGNFNFKDKDYKIYYFAALISKYKLKLWSASNSDKYENENWIKINKEMGHNNRLISEFQQQVIDNFCSEPFDELAKYTLWAKYLPQFNHTQIKYKKDYLFSQYEIGKDMLEEENGLIIGAFRGVGTSYAVPLTRPDIIKFFDDNAPKEVYKIVKRL